MSSEKAKKEQTRIQDEFEQLKFDINLKETRIELSDHLASNVELPNFGELETYDYDHQLEDSNRVSSEVLESLVDLYLDDLPALKSHPYIQKKMQEDALVYGEAIFLTRITRRNLINQMVQIDNGDSTSRMHEIVNQTISQVRENSKFLGAQKTELEKFYKTLRKDFGYEEIQNETVKQETTSVDESDSEDGIIMDNMALNEMIRKAREENEAKNTKK